jgi:uncharacterized membrane protein YdjX (TVP38/TMEM64 family)
MGVLINLIISGIGIFAGALIAFYFYRKSM